MDMKQSTSAKGTPHITIAIIVHGGGKKPALPPGLPHDMESQDTADLAGNPADVAPDDTLDMGNEPDMTSEPDMAPHHVIHGLHAMTTPRKPAPRRM